MKLRNKKTGEILGGLGSFIIQNPNRINCEAITKYDSLAELNEEWEDYEEPKSTINDVWFNSTLADGHFVEIDFISDEEAEKAVEKLKAWKRLKDKGFEIEGWNNNIGDNYYKTGQIVLNLNNVRNREWNEFVQISEIKNDLDLLFGGEE